ncbi:MAG: hypothetical protein GKR98_02915 [Boseongicola sp.]|nr:MAG: hypothetical protein GKR98_02915 [Boseongicola sp.]
MDMTFVNDAARAVHLLGLAMGFGGAIIADISAVRAVVRALDHREIEMLRLFHKVVFTGLALLWGSGLVLLWLRTGFDPDNFSPKLITKIGVVVLLTLNAVAIGRIGLPTIVAYQSWRFGDLPLPLRFQLSALGTMSAACWISALCLGAFSQLKSMSWEALSHMVGIVYLAALCLAVIAATITPLVGVFVRYRERRRHMQALGVGRVHG